MRHIVVGVDSSEHAAAALRWSMQEANLHGGNITAVMAWGFLDQHHAHRGARFDPAYGEAEAVAALDEAIRAAVGTDAATVTRRAVCDLPVRALLGGCAEADLLVVGRRGLGGFRGLLLGSVSDQCIRHASIPVVVVHDEPADLEQARERIVVGVDGSVGSQRALGWAVAEGAIRQAAVDAVYTWHVPYATDPFGTFPIDPTSFEGSARALLEEAVAAEDASGLPAPVETLLVSGAPAAALLEQAKGADLLVVGSRGRGGFVGLLLGSVSQQVAHHATVPVVVVPPDRRLRSS